MGPNRNVLRKLTVHGVLVSLSAGGSAVAGAQLPPFFGPHEVETVETDGTIPGTGRIGGITVDAYGYMYVANQDDGVWKVHPSGEVELFVTGLWGSAGNVVLRNGDLLQTSYNGNRIVRVERDGTVHPFVSEGLDGPVGITAVRDGTVYTVNYRGNTICRITPEGSVTEFVSDERLDGPNGITSDPQGNLYVVNMNNTLVLKVTPAGEVTEIARLPGDGNAHVAWSGNALYVTQIWMHAVLRVEMNGTYSVVAGDGTRGFEDGTPAESRVSYPNGITALGNEVYFNTLDGDMLRGHAGTIVIRRLQVPNPIGRLVQAFREGGVEGLEEQFQVFASIEAIPIDQLAGAMYQGSRQLFDMGESQAGLALVEWTAALDTNTGRSAGMLGRAHAQFGDKAVAVGHFERAIAADPDNEDLKLRLQAVQLYRRGR